MPMVNGQEFPYTPEGEAQADAARSAPGPGAGPPGGDVSGLLQQLKALFGGQAGGAMGDMDIQKLLPLMLLLLKQQGGGPEGPGGLGPDMGQTGASPLGNGAPERPSPASALV